jgi:UDP-N-acetylglucosamine acyltransferase
MSGIHGPAVVDPAAEVGPNVQIGPYCVVGAGVRIGGGCQLDAHVVIEGPCEIGPDNRFHPFASIGGPPQDKKYRGEPTSLRIGAGNTFRECVTVNRGTVQDQGCTEIGNDNWIMAYVHIAHDCRIGDHTIFANTTNLAGHVQVDDWAILGGCTQVHQFCQIGAHAMTGAGTVLLHDLPPFVMASGNTAEAHGLNAEGLRRRGFSAERIQTLRRAYKLLYKQGLGFEEARAQIGSLAQADAASAGDLGVLSAFLARVTRGIVR